MKRRRGKLTQLQRHFRARQRREALEPVGRWTPLRKFSLALAIRRGIVTPAQAVAAHDLSGEELGHWLALYDAGVFDRFKLPGRQHDRRRRDAQEHLQAAS